jgi:hypothetical protein
MVPLLFMPVRVRLVSQSPNTDESEDEGGDAADYREHVADIVNHQMMYVSGETGEPSAETTGMIEEIVRQQVIEIVSNKPRCLPVAALPFATSLPS